MPTSAQGSNSQGGTGVLPSATYAVTNNDQGGGNYTLTDDVTDALGRTWRYTMQTGSGAYEAIRRPGSSADNVRINKDSSNRVTTIVRDGATWTYSFATPSSNMSTLTVTDPTNRVRKYQSDVAVGLPTRIEDEYGRVTAYTYDTSGRLKTGTLPDGQVTTYDYDGRGNVTKTTVTAKGGGATLSSSAAYPTDCPNAVTCNLPTSTTDVRGVVTSYGYDPTHGGITSAVTTNPGGVNPRTETRYTQVSGVWMATSSWTCRTTASCENGADAVKTGTAYNSNLLPTSVTVGAGDNSLQAVTTMTYTAAGDLLTVDGPLAGAGDTARYYYDAARQRLGAIGPDPDGSGVRLSRAARIGYDSWGRVTSVAQGTASGQGDSALANMTVLQTQTATLDDAGRTKSVAASSGGTTFARTDYAYDIAGRPTCTAVRMTGLGAAADACSVGSDATYGSDRVRKVDYSAAGAGNPASTSVTSAFGTPAASTETVLQTVNGKPASVTDANGNVTSFAYDAFDRPWRTCFQTASSATCAGSAGDYEQTNYATNGDIGSVRLRDDQVAGYGYDALGRLTSKGRVINGTVQVEQSYAYDLVGNLTQASDPSGRVLGFSYDALGRKTAQSDNVYAYGNASFQYDAAGNRTRFTFNDGLYVSYDYLANGAPNTIRDSAGTALVTFGYDDLGRRTSLTRSNGAPTTYAYDAVSRLSQLKQDLAGGSFDATMDFAYNPAGQIRTRTVSDDDYAWNKHYNLDRSYGVNGLNQLTTAGATALGYDARGNLTSSGSTSYTYNIDNQLLTMTGVSGTLVYDPLGRLSKGSIGAPTSPITALSYDGPNLIAETNTGNGNLLRRYIHGPGTDEPLIWYEGSGTGDRRWHHADERGTIVAVSNDSGTMMVVNRYDEFGIPSSGNVGRFLYTGQKWIGTLGLYDYKARMYSPSLGRFMQTDPIGYADGINWYNYVGSDPINKTDPSGLWRTVCSYSSSSSGIFGTDSYTVYGYQQCTNVLDPSDLSPANGSNSNGGGYTRPPIVKSINSLNQSSQNDPICKAPLSAPANRGKSISSRRAQVRAEVARAVNVAMRTGGDVGAAFNAEVGRNAARLAPGGSWIRGQASPADGNRLYGAITAELGVPLGGALAFGDIDEIIDDALGLIGIRPYDGNFGSDSQAAKDQIKQGAGC